MTLASTATLDALIGHLAGGDFHSGEELGGLLGVSRAAVWKQLQKLELYGLQVESVKGKGYRLRHTLDLLDTAQILHASKRDLSKLTFHLSTQTDSTNAQAMQAAASGAHGYVFLAEQQLAGRGRRGRPWVSPFAANMYLSLVWAFAGGAAALSGLSLAVGVACARALNSVGVQGVALKWPNDLLLGSQKLGGILLEMTGDPAGDCQVVIGIGINVDMSTEQAQQIDQPWTDIKSSGCEVSRNQLAAALLEHLVEVLEAFAVNGFVSVQSDWLALDAFAAAPVTLTSGAQSWVGVARGVDEQGALLLESEGQLRAYHGGELSLRRRQESS